MLEKISGPEWQPFVIVDIIILLVLKIMSRILVFIATISVLCNFLIPTGILGQITLKHITHTKEKKSLQARRIW